ncbi:MAG: hypothetical protein QOF89_3225 [Acidobacteriota bacterium]|jgi:hypothetical protein|nr:hypothetical protein [Acidobacteriota bacterium]
MGHPFIYEELLHDFKPPNDPHAKVWRFMSFAKYVSLLESQSIFFARADTLADNFEGSQTRRTRELREKFLGSLPKSSRKWIGGGEIARELTYVSCWHLNDHESQGMWKLYVDGVDGVAIQSRFKALEDCLQTDSRNDVCVGCVNYADYESDQFCDDWMTPFTYKRYSFRHESEVRAIIFPRNRPDSPPAREDLQSGLPIKVDLSALVESVYASPYSSSWFYDLVCVVSQRYALQAPIRVSNLRSEPVY